MTFYQPQLPPKLLPQSCYRFLLTTLLITVVGTQAQDLVFIDHVPASGCVLKSGAPGRCVAITDCPSVLKDLATHRPEHCRFDGNLPIVCCPRNAEPVTEKPPVTPPPASSPSPQTSPMSPPTSPPTQSPLVDVSEPPGYDDLNCGRSATKLVDDFSFDGSFGPFLTARTVSGTSGPSVASPGPSMARRSVGFLELERLPVDEVAVVGGHKSRRNAWPWMALLGHYERGDDIRWFCAGVLLNTQWVLSASHCITHSEADVVRLGEHDYSDDNDEADHQDFGVAQTILYPDYTPLQAYHDLALLRLSSEVRLQTFIRPVCLSWGFESDKNLIGQTVTVTGWGNTQFGGHRSSILQEVKVKVFPSSDCDRSYSSLRSYRESWPQGIGNETVCAGHREGGKDACQGDSGGPLVFREPGGRYKGRYTLGGIVSRGYGCGHSNFPGLYANPRHKPYLAWIKKVAF